MKSSLHIPNIRIIGCAKFNAMNFAENLDFAVHHKICRFLYVALIIQQANIGIIFAINHKIYALFKFCALL